MTESWLVMKPVADNEFHCTKCKALRNIPGYWGTAIAMECMECHRPRMEFVGPYIKPEPIVSPEEQEVIEAKDREHHLAGEIEDLAFCLAGDGNEELLQSVRDQLAGAWYI